MILKKYLLVILFLLFFSVNLCAEFIFRDGYTRPAGLGNAFTAMNDDAYSIFFNPAGLGYLNSVMFISNNARLYGLSDLKINNAGIVVPLEILNIGLGYDEYGFDLYKEKTYMLSAAKKLSENFSLGTSLKMYELDISSVGKKSDVSIDAGFNYSAFNNKLSFGFLARDLNKPEISDKIDRSYSFGLKYIFSNFKLVVDYFIPKYDYDNRIFSGIELDLNRYVTLRSGIQTKPDNYSFGLGLNFGKINTLVLDYAYIHHQIMDATHLFGLGYKFGTDKKDDFYEGINAEQTKEEFVAEEEAEYYSENDNAIADELAESESVGKNKIYFSPLNEASKKPVLSLKEQILISKKFAADSVKKFQIISADTVGSFDTVPALFASDKDTEGNISDTGFEIAESGKQITEIEKSSETINSDLAELDKLTFIKPIKISKIINNIDDIWDAENDEEINATQAYYLIGLLDNPLNINEANPSELIQLPNITKDEIEALVNYRIKKGIIRDKEELVLNNIISQNTFDFINIFIEAKESKKIEKDERPEMFVYKGIANEKTDNNSKAKIYQSLEYDYNDIQGYGLVERDAGEDEFDNLKKFGVKINNIKNKKIDIVAGNFNVGFGNFHTISTIMYEKRTKTVKEDNSIIPQIIDIDRQTNEDKYLQGIAVQKRGIFAENLNLSCFYSNKFYDDISDSIKSELKAEITGANFNYDFSSRLAAGILGFAGDFVCKDLPQYDFENAVFGMYLRYKSDYDVDITFEAAKSNKGGKGIMVGIDHKTKKYDLNIVIYSNDCDYVNMLAYKSEFSEKDKRGAKPELTVYLDRNHKLTASYELNKILSSDVTQRQSEIKINGNYDKKSALINRISFLKSFQYAFKFSFYNNDVNDWAGANPRGYEPYYYITYRDESVYKNPKQSYNFQFNFINNLDYTCNIDFYKKENFSYGKPAFNDDYSFLQKFRYKLDSNNEFQTDYYIKKYKDIKNYNLVSETAEYSQYWYFNAQYYRKFSKKDSVKFSYQYRDYENSSFQDFHRFGSELRLQNFSMVLKNYFKYYKESSSKEFEINLTKNW